MNTSDGLLYGAGDAKIGSVVGKGSNIGKKLKNLFFEQVPALGTLLSRLQAFVKNKGYVPGIDGRKIRIRMYEGKLLVHTSLNTMLQGNGSIAVKKWLVYVNELVKKERLDARQVLYIHDEIQFDCSPEHADRLTLIFKEAMNKVNEAFKMRIPLDVEAKIGHNWGDTH